MDATYLGDSALPGGGEVRVAALQSEMKKTIAGEPKITAMGKEIFIEDGKRIYAQACFACHQAEGQGLPGVFPPLAKSDYLMADKKDRAILGIIKGQTGEMVVNGQKYNGVMPPVLLTDEQIAHVPTLFRNSRGNSGDIVTAEKCRRSTRNR